MDRTPDLPRDELTDKPHKSCECKLLDEKGNKADEFLLQVSVFVAMPSPPQNHLPKDSSAEQEGQVPDLSLGVVRIALPRTKEDLEDEADEVNGEIVV
ncbi:hypothetical protein ONZ45_g19239 [Pleurotus djamor]|nr:hypothetical protein ONZ45_g19239 [Pleurotus djamor]